MENQDFLYTVTPLYAMPDTLRSFASIGSEISGKQTERSPVPRENIVGYVPCGFDCLSTMRPFFSDTNGRAMDFCRRSVSDSGFLISDKGHMPENSFTCGFLCK
jgi:hypothetical protein